MLEGRKVGKLEGEWAALKDAVFGREREVYEVKKVGLGRGGKGSEWWSEEMRELIR